MFFSTRLKLTTWYVLIITIVCILFTLAIYKALSDEVDRIALRQQSILEHSLGVFNTTNNPVSSDSADFDVKIYENTKDRIRLILIFINLIILTIAGIASYFLAGRTLKPIEEMLQEQNRFITDASHELRTPLTSLKTTIEVNLRDKKLSIEEARALLESNLEEVNNLQLLADGLIRLAQYQKFTDTLSFEKLWLQDVVTDAVKKVSGIAKQKQIEFKVNKLDYYLEGDNKSLVELFVIFFDNAIKYSPKNTKVTISANRFDDYIHVNISDKGIGISKEDVSYIFNRFFRADQARSKERVSGYGLGLSIARKIVDVHGGLINVTSTINKGTTFTIQLPEKIHKKKF